MLRRLRFFNYLAITFAIWVAIRMVNDYSLVLHVPVKYVNIPAKLQLTKALPDKLTISVRGKGQDFILPYLGIYLDTLQIDMQDALRRNYLLTRNLSEPFKAQLPESYNILGIYPDTIPIHFIEKITKRVPVVARVTLKTDAGFFISRAVHLEPDSIVLMGTEQDLKYINSWATEDIMVRDIHENGSLTVPLKPSTDLLLSHAQVKLYYRAERFTEVARELEVQVVGIPDSYVRILPQRITVRYLVPLNRYEELSNLPLQAVLNGRDLNPEALYVAPTITNVPEGVHRLRMSPPYVRFVKKADS
jgi:hypothetical protein